MPTLGHIDFDILKESYEEQINGLIDGGIDLLLIETCQDVLQIKSALLASQEVIKNKNIDLPIMISITMETTGTMLVGSDIASALTILEPFNIDILGLNCATGPVQMKDHIKYLFYLYKHFNIKIIIIDNAGYQFIDSANESELFREAGLAIKFFDFNTEKQGVAYDNELKRVKRVC